MTETTAILLAGYPSVDEISVVNRPALPGQTSVVDCTLPPMPGGCPLNIAVALARLGLIAVPLVQVGDDAAGRQLLEVLHREGVEVRGVEVLAGGSTPSTRLYLTPAGDHQVFYRPGITAPLQVPGAWPFPVGWKVVTVGDPAHTRALLETEPRAPLLWSHKDDAASFPQPLLERLAATARVLVLNEAEAAAVVATLELPGIDSLAGENRWVYVTRGAQGCDVYASGRRSTIAAIAPASLVDPTGAGDAFVAGILWGLTEGADALGCARRGAAVASFALEGWGCQETLPARAQALERLSLG